MQSFRNTYRVLDNADARSVAALEAAGVEDFVQYRPFVAGQHQKHAYQTGEWERGVLSMGQAVAFVRQPQTVAEIYRAAAARGRGGADPALRRSQMTSAPLVLASSSGSTWIRTWESSIRSCKAASIRSQISWARATVMAPGTTR